jgi:serine protease Do
MCVYLASSLSFSQTPPRPARSASVFTHGSTSFLGVGVVEVDSDRAKALNLKEERGVEVKNVDADSPADRAGIKQGDVILDYNGQRVEGLTQFVRMISETPAGRKVTLLVSRNGATQTITAVIGARANRNIMVETMGDMALVAPMAPTPPTPVLTMPDFPGGIMSWQSATLGIESEALGPQLAEYFGVKEGVLVRAVSKRSPAEKAGVKAGDVITKVDGNSVKGPREISSALRAARGKKTLSFQIVRNHKDMTLDITPSNEWSSSDWLTERNVL